MAKNKQKSADLRALFPGRVVNVNGVDIMVVPMGVRHLRRFSDAVAKIMPTLITVVGDQNDSQEAWVRKLVSTILPFALSDLLVLIDDCVDVDLEDLPQWVLPKIAEVWVEESFGSEEKIRPWKDLMVSMKAKFLSPQSSTPSASLSRLAGTTSAT